jgi:hypothetical protein
MPYDPNFPATNEELLSLSFRAQFTGLKELIDAVPTITGAQVNGVNTLPPGDPAAAGASVSDGVLHLTFDIPAGQSGPPGEVTAAQLAAEILTTAHNPTSVQPISGSFSDPVSAGDLNTVKDKLNELIAALMRLP